MSVLSIGGGVNWSQELISAVLFPDPSLIHLKKKLARCAFPVLLYSSVTWEETQGDEQTLACFCKGPEKVFPHLPSA